MGGLDVPDVPGAPAMELTMSHEPPGQPGQGGGAPPSPKLRLALAILDFGVPGKLMLGAG